MTSPDVFISYSSKDGELARRLADYLKQHELEVFLAELSIQPGAEWKNSIVAALRGARWFFFLATPASCASTPVMHEIGGAIFLQKEFVSLLDGVSPAQIPAWVQSKHAVDLRDTEKVSAFIQATAEKVKSDKALTAVVTAGLLALGGYLVLKNSK